VTAAPGKDADGTYHAVATAGGQTIEECRAALDEELLRETNSFIEQFLYRGDAPRYFVRLPVDYIRDHILKDEYVRTRESAGGYWMSLHALLEFDREVQRELDRRLDEQTVAVRLGYTALGCLLGLVALGAFFGYLKLDTWTKGFYTWRLRIVTAAVILSAAVVAEMMRRGLIIEPWLYGG
jgi:hypothetical protein